MARVIRVQGQVVFPPVCAVCLRPAEKHYHLERTFSYGRESVQAEVEVPLCARHHRVASRRSWAEKLLARLGLWLGIVLGLLVWAALVISWAANHEGSLVPNLFLGLAVGAGIFLVFWAATTFWLAPRFADRDSLRVREAVRILRFWPGDELMELEIENDQVADLVQPSENRSLDG